MKYLEQKFITDNPKIFYNRQQLKEHDDFMEKYVFPLDKELNSKNFNPHGNKYNLFVLAYNQLSPEVKKVLKEVYLEYRILYFKKKIEIIIIKNTFKQDKKSFDNYIRSLGDIIGYERVNKFLDGLK